MSKQSSPVALRKSVARYARMSFDIRQPRSAAYRETLAYLRSLYAQYGQAAVRRELKRIRT